MKILFEDKKLKDIDAHLEIVLVKKHKYLSVNEMFLKDKKLYVKVENYYFYTIIEKLASTIKYIKNTTKNKTVKISLYGVKDQEIQALIDGIQLGGYSFERYKSKVKKSSLEKIYIVNEDYKKVNFSYKKIKNKIEKYIKINENINFTREIINSVAEDTTPKKLVKWIEKSLSETNIKISVKDEDFIKKELPAFYDISKGSENKPYLVHLKYNENQNYKKIVLIGKGVTFDTGGISLKPSEYMYDMRLDKSGAITILGLIKAIHDLNLPIEIQALLGFSENMIGSKAYKPGDILKTRSGKTIEVMNTDAEGRILLADLFEYAQDKISKIDYIFDYATLTGSVVSAIGQYSSAVIGHNEKLKNTLIKTSKKVDEWYVDLPFNRYFFQNSYQSAIADFTNTPSSSIGGGTIMGGVFIDNFIKKENKDKWLHIDISGVAFIKNSWKYHDYGATGFGIKSGVDFIQSLLL